MNHKQQRILLALILIAFSLLWVVTLNPRIEAIMQAIVYGVLLYTLFTNQPDML